MILTQKKLAQRAAQISNGEICTRCHGSNHILPPPGKPTLCIPCVRLDQEIGEAAHGSLMRCPHCSEVQKVFTDDEHERYKEGYHIVACRECDEWFEIMTVVAYTFYSPAKNKEANA